MPKQVQLSPLGEYLRTIRMKENMSADDMAKHIGMTVPMLYKVETGARNAPQDFVEKCKLLKHFLHFTTLDEQELEDAWLSCVDKVEVKGVNKRIAYALKSATDDQLKRIEAILAENTKCID